MTRNPRRQHQPHRYVFTLFDRLRYCAEFVVYVSLSLVADAMIYQIEF
jgi:hypothetical protein